MVEVDLITTMVKETLMIIEMTSTGVVLTETTTILVTEKIILIVTTTLIIVMAEMMDLIMITEEMGSIMIETIITGMGIIIPIVLGRIKEVLICQILSIHIIHLITGTIHHILL